MTQAVDSNILLDIIGGEPQHFGSSRQALLTAARRERVIVAEPVLSEIAPAFGGHVELMDFLSRLGISFQRSAPEAFHRAGVAFRRYLLRRGRFRCPQCGAPFNAPCARCGATITGRQHILADFLIGAHAAVHAGRLLTRDRGYYGAYFPDLTLV